MTTDRIDVRRPSKFFMVENAAIGIMTELGRTAFCVYCALLQYANRAGECWPRVSTIADDIGASVRTVQVELRKLEGAGLLIITEVIDSPSIYEVRDPSDRAVVHTPANAVVHTEPERGPVQPTAPPGAAHCTTPVQPTAPPLTYNEQDPGEQDPMNNTAKDSFATRTAATQTSPSLARRQRSAQNPATSADDTASAWTAYARAFERRYGVPPIRNAKVNGQFAQLAKRLPHADIASVVEFYLGHNDAFYVRSAHPVGLLLRDAEKLHMEWLRGRKITSQDAKEAERIESNLEMWERVSARIDAAKSGGKE